jgi:PAS domain S-box-containing protein
LIWWCVVPLVVLAAVLANYHVRQAQTAFELRAKQVAHDFAHAIEGSQSPQIPGAADLTLAQQATLQKTLDQVALPPQWRLSLLDNTKAVIAQRGFPKNQSANAASDDAPWRFTTGPQNLSWAVVLEIPRRVYYTPLIEALIHMVLAIVSATAVAVLGGRQVSRSMAKALDALLNATAPDAPEPLVTDVGARTTDGSSAEIHGTLQDVTQHRQASEWLRVSEHALQSISQGVLISDAQGRLLSANQSFLTMTGFSKDDILGQTCHFVQGPLTDPATRQRMREAAHNQTEFSGEILNYRQDGSTFWNDLSISPVFNEQGQLSHFIGIIRDISARKKIETELQQHRDALEQMVASRTAELTQSLQDSMASRQRLLFEIHEHRRTEARLHHSQLTLSQAARIAQLGAWRIDLHDLDNILDNPVTWSDEMYRLLDYTRQGTPESSAELFFARVHPEDRDAFHHCAMQALANKTAWQTEYRLVQTDGSVRWVVETGEFVFDASGAPMSMHGAVKDITDQRRIEHQLRDSEANLHQALEGARAACYEWGIETRCGIWSEEYWSLVGLLPNAVPASREAWLEAVHPDDRVRVIALAEAAASQLTDYEFEWRVNLPDNLPTRWLLDRCQPVIEPDGRVVRYRGIVIDITQRKQAELSLDRYRALLEERVAERTAELAYAVEKQRRLNRALRLLSECNGAMVRATNEQQLLADLCQRLVTTGGYRMGWVGVVEHDAAKSIRMVAQSGEHDDYLLAAPVGWDDTQAMGHGPMGMAVRAGVSQINADYASPHMAPWREAALKRGYRASMALPIFIGKQVWGVLALYSSEPQTFGMAEVQLLEQLANDMAYGLQSLRAQSELENYRQQLEDRVNARTHEIASLNTALEAKARDAEAASRAKSTFLATMSHELRTPLNAVVGLTGLLAESLTERRQRDYADKIQLSAKALRALIDDILDYAKIEAGALTLERAPFSLNAILRVAAAVVSVGVRNKPIEVLFDVAPGVPDAFMGDSLRLQQILLNLSSNAVKFTESGVIVVSVRCLAQDAGQAKLLFCVRDTGIGIPSAQLGPIFDVFTQAGHATSRVYGGTGLGLAISARLADLMGAEIEADSALDWGSEFRFTLTLDRAPVTPITAGPDVPPALNVLVIDDHSLARAILVQTCAALGWQAQGVDSAEAGLQALRDSMAQAADYDLVLLDWRMPGTDGLAMLRQAYAAPDIRLPIVVLMTSVFELELAAAASDDLALDGITTKPVTPASLREAVARAFASEFRGILPTPLSIDRRLQGMRLLVADDNDINLEMMTHILTHAGADVTSVVNGREAVEALRPPDAQFDAVLMDIQMPLMDGYEATRQIREQLGRVDLPIIAVTAFALPEDREKSHHAGMVGHVVKPLDVTALLDILVKHRLAPSSARPDLNAAKQADPDTRPPVLNTAAALKAFGGAPGPYRTLLRKFITQHGDDAVEAARLWQTHAPQEAAQRMHDLRGMAGILHATALGQRAAATEDALRNSPDTADMPRLFDELQAAMAQVKAAVEALDGSTKSV